MEIERKFTLKRVPDNLEKYRFRLIEQAYLCIDPVVRVRREDDEFYLTYKGSGRPIHLVTNEGLDVSASEIVMGDNKKCS